MTRMEIANMKEEVYDPSQTLGDRPSSEQPMIGNGSNHDFVFMRTYFTPCFGQLFFFLYVASEQTLSFFYSVFLTNLHNTMPSQPIIQQRMERRWKGMRSWTRSSSCTKWKRKRTAVAVAIRHVGPFLVGLLLNQWVQGYRQQESNRLTPARRELETQQLPLFPNVYLKKRYEYVLWYLLPWRLLFFLCFSVFTLLTLILTLLLSLIAPSSSNGSQKCSRIAKEKEANRFFEASPILAQPTTK